MKIDSRSSFVFVFLAAILQVLFLIIPAEAVSINGKDPTVSFVPEYAENYSIDYYEEGYKLITLADGQQFLIVPEKVSVPEVSGSNIAVLQQPIHNIYLAATAVMCLFDALDELESIRLSGTRAEGWYIENARTAMEAGMILFAGKYSEPDYELLLQNRCTLAIESQMIRHTPEVQEKLEELGIPVLVDLSSSEPHPLGRTEWIRLYAAFFDAEEKAEELFREQAAYLDSALTEGDTGKSAAFFYISSSGLVVVRKSGDYVSRMISLAGGKYVFDDIGDPEKSTSTVTIEMETFFAAAKDADALFYNSTIAGEINTLDELLAKNELLDTFKAVQTGNVWCTTQNMYQDTTQLGQMIQSFHRIFSGDADSLDEIPYFYRLK